MYSYGRSKTAADQILIRDLPPDKYAFTLEISKKTGAVSTQAWEGIHGYSVDFRLGRPLRLTPPLMKFLLASPHFRWVQSLDSKHFSVGM